MAVKILLIALNIVGIMYIIPTVSGGNDAVQLEKKEEKVEKPGELSEDEEKKEKEEKEKEEKEKEERSKEFREKEEEKEKREKDKKEKERVQKGKKR